MPGRSKDASFLFVGFRKVFEEITIVRNAGLVSEIIGVQVRMCYFTNQDQDGKSSGSGNQRSDKKPF